MSAYPSAALPWVPYPKPIQVPVADVTDEPTVSFCINAEWLSVVIGCLYTLTHQSTWSSNLTSEVDRAVNNGYELLHLLMQAEPCPVPVEFRLNPLDPHYWDYSNDGGATWTRQPDCPINFTPTWPVDGLAASGYDLSVNGGLSQTPVPLIVATDPDAVITDPGTLTRNLITATTGADGLLIQALATIGVSMVQNNGVALALNKIPGFGLATSALELLAGGTDYTYPLIEVLDA